MVLFNEGSRSVVERVRVVLPDRFSIEEEIEENHRLFKDEGSGESVAVMRIENIREKYYEVDLFEDGAVRESETFDDVQGMVAFLESEY
jgi:hypothetical protein